MSDYESRRIQLTLLGRFAVSSGGRPPQPVRIHSQKGRALLAYLAMQRNQNVNRDRLATLLWGDRLDTRARHNLRQCLLRLRTDLGSLSSELLIFEGDEIRLRSDLLTVDAVEFEALARSSELADLERAAALYGGEFLGEFTLEAEPFDDWVRTERARLEVIAARVLEACAERLDALGDGQGAIAAAERLIALDRLREDWQRRLLVLYARSRGRESALAHAKALVGLLRSELDVGPDAGTMALIEDIDRGAIAPRPSSPSPMDTAPGAIDPIRSELPAATVHGPPGGRAGLFRPLAWVAAAALVCAAGAVAFFLPRLDPPKSVERRGLQDVPSSHNQLAVDEAWRSPSIRSDVAVDKQALAARGLIPVVVLPFRTYGDARDQVIAEHITDDLINDLSRTPALRVISGQTSRLYRDRPIDVAALGHELGVRYVITGGVRTDGDLLRINVDLIDATTRLQAWSNRLEREWSQQFAIQNEITRGLARSLQVEAIVAEGRRSSESSPEPEIVNLLGKGWAAVWRSHSLGTTGAAEAVFGEVLKQDPDNLSATVGLAAAHLAAVGNLLVSDREPYLIRAEELLSQALAKHPGSSSAYFHLGAVHKLRGRTQAALEAFRKALELNPSYPAAYAQLGHLLIRLGRAEEALEHFRYAMRLSPKDSGLPQWARWAGQAEIELGRDEAAVEWLKKSVALGPTQPWNHASLAAAYALIDDMESAAKHLAKIGRFAPWALDTIKAEAAEKSTKETGPSRLWQGLRKALASSS